MYGSRSTAWVGQLPRRVPDYWTARRNAGRTFALHHSQLHAMSIFIEADTLELCAIQQRADSSFAARRRHMQIAIADVCRQRHRDQPHLTAYSHYAHNKSGQHCFGRSIASRSMHVAVCALQKLPRTPPTTFRVKQNPEATKARSSENGRGLPDLHQVPILMSIKTDTTPGYICTFSALPSARPE
jgi:hypothetical protein